MELLMIAVCNLFSLYVFADSKSMLAGTNLSLWREMSGFAKSELLRCERKKNYFNPRRKK
jgi:hypothetical protein